MKCPKCKSKQTLAHTDKELRSRRVLYWQCHNCEHNWETNFAEYNKSGKYRLVVNWFTDSPSADPIKNKECELICPHCNIELAAQENK